MHKRKIFILIFILIICSVVFFVVQNSTVTHENQFGITEIDSFTMSHFFNVDGVVGYEKTEFNQKEIQQILKFLTGLKYIETLDMNREKEYGVPVKLTVNKQDGDMIFLLHSKNEIEVKREDKKGNVLSDELYKTTAGQLKNMYVIVGLPDKET